MRVGPWMKRNSGFIWTIFFGVIWLSLYIWSIFRVGYVPLKSKSIMLCCNVPKQPRNVWSTGLWSCASVLLTIAKFLEITINVYLHQRLNSLQKNTYIIPLGYTFGVSVPKRKGSSSKHPFFRFNLSILFRESSDILVIRCSGWKNHKVLAPNFGGKLKSPKRTNDG